MAIEDPRPPTRKELAQVFANNQRLIRAFEKLFDLVPGQFNIDAESIEEALVAADSAGGAAFSALAETAALSEVAQLLQLAPAAEPLPSSLIDGLSLLQLAPPTEPYTPPRYGQFRRTTDDTLAAANTAEMVAFDTADLSFGVVIDGTTASRIVVDRAGRYEFGATFSVLSTTAAVKNLWFWFRLNGADVAGSAVKETLGTSNDRDDVRLSRLFDLAPSDYVELAWAADSTDVALDAEAASAFAPAVAACILSVKQIK